MKQSLRILLFCLAGSFIVCMHACKKDNIHYPPPPPPPPPPPVLGDTIRTSFVEDFTNWYYITDSVGWQSTGHIQGSGDPTYGWGIGYSNIQGKGDTVLYGFPGFEDSVTTDGLFAYSYVSHDNSTLSISNWLLTPMLEVKNGDKISFYTRGDSSGVYNDRMQVLMDTLGTIYVGNDLSSLGDYTNLIIEINASQAPGGYPTTWTKYEYTFKGFAASKIVRIGFRHVTVNPKNSRGIGIDHFEFVVK